MCVCVYVCVYIYIYIHTHTHRVECLHLENMLMLLAKMLNSINGEKALQDHVIASLSSLQWFCLL